jgi:hypothetical protein
MMGCSVTTIFFYEITTFIKNKIIKMFGHEINEYFEKKNSIFIFISQNKIKFEKVLNK